jgi:hypothetical protein
MKYISLILFLSLLLFGCSNEQADWNKAVSSNTLQNYESFVGKYPAGKYADSANAKIEEISFKNAWASDSLAKLELFVNKYPKGRFADSVNNRIFELKNTEQGKLVGVTAIMSLDDAARGIVKKMYYDGKVIIQKPNGEKREALCANEFVNKLKGGQTLKVTYDRTLKDWKVVAIVNEP